jgi:hypothetical protein
VLSAFSVAAALLGGTASATAQEAMPAPPPMMSPVSTPAMAGPLSANPNPFSMDLGILGEKVYVGGAVTGLALAQTHATKAPGSFDNPTALDMSNGQVFIQKVDGFFQYYIQVGEYSTPSLGTPYVKASTATPGLFGVVPQAFVKFVPADNFSILAGKLPTLVGDEYTFTFENMNIIRGLLWNQEPAVSRGVQANYTVGPITLSLSANDGYYSNRWNWLSGLVSWAIDKENTLVFVGAGNTGSTGFVPGLATPYFQNNSSIYNVIFTHSSGPWVISPYFQYSSVPFDARRGILKSASTTGGAILVSYAFNDNFKLAGRFEYISSTGRATPFYNSTNLLFGPGSDAWSITITPTYQFNNFFVRAEYSYVGASGTTPGFAIGPTFSATSQSRGMLETGVLF